MDQEASFAPRSVLGPRRAGWNHLVILVPALALATIAWAGVSGAGSSRPVAESPHVVAVAAPSIDAVASPVIALSRRVPAYPAQVVGLDVQRLDVVATQELGPDTPVAGAGWNGHESPVTARRASGR